MKTITSLILFLFFCNQVIKAQSNTWFATLSGNEGKVESTKQIAHDEYGNIYTLSSSQNAQNVIKSSYQNQSYALPPTKDYNLVFTKYSPKGKILWSLTIDGRSNAAANILCDQKGAVYIAGTYFDQTNLSSTNGQETYIARDNKNGCFLAKYDYEGRLVAHNYIVGGDNVTNMVFDRSGALFFAMEGSNMRRNISLSANTQLTLPSTGEQALFVKYSANCQYLDHWLLTATELSRVQVQTNSKNQIVLGGAYKGILNIDNQVNLRAKYNGEKLGGDIFFATLSSAGQLQWSKSFGGATANFLATMLVDSRDHIIFDGIIRSEIIMNNDRLYNPTGYMRGFWAKLDATGNTVWKGIQPRCDFNEIKLNDKDEIYMVGDYSKSLTMPDINKRFVATSTNPAPTIVAKYSPAGKCVWAEEIVNSPLVSSFEIVNGDLYICGILKGNPNTVCFQINGNPDGFVIPRNDHFDGFVAKLGMLPNEQRGSITDNNSNAYQEENNVVDNQQNNPYQNTNPYQNNPPIENNNTKTNNSSNTTIGQHEMLLHAAQSIEIEIKDENGEVIYRTKIPANGKYDLTVTPK